MANYSETKIHKNMEESIARDDEQYIEETQTGKLDKKSNTENRIKTKCVSNGDGITNRIKKKSNNTENRIKTKSSNTGNRTETKYERNTDSTENRIKKNTRVQQTIQRTE